MYGNEYNYFTTYFSVGCESSITWLDFLARLTRSPFRLHFLDPLSNRHYLLPPKPLASFLGNRMGYLNRIDRHVHQRETGVCTPSVFGSVREFSISRHSYVIE